MPTSPECSHHPIDWDCAKVVLDMQLVMLQLERLRRGPSLLSRQYDEILQAANGIKLITEHLPRP